MSSRAEITARFAKAYVKASKADRGQILGFADVVSASYYDGALAVFFNNKNSPGTFNPPRFSTVPAPRSSPSPT